MADLPKGEQIKLVTGITRLMHSPEIVTGTTSSTGKTVSVEAHGDTYRLKTAKLLNGESEFRGSFYFEAYTPAAMQKNQRANHNPGPVAGAEEITDTDRLPAPSPCVVPFQSIARRVGRSTGSAGVSLYTKSGKRLRLSVERARALRGDLCDGLRETLKRIEAA